MLKMLLKMPFKKRKKKSNGRFLLTLFCLKIVTSTDLSSCSYVVDAADYENLSVSKSELHDLLSKPSLNGIPLLVLGNKIDKQGALSKQDLTERM